MLYAMPYKCNLMYRYYALHSIAIASSHMFILCQTLEEKKSPSDTMYQVSSSEKMRDKVTQGVRDILLRFTQYACLYCNPSRCNRKK